MKKILITLFALLYSAFLPAQVPTGNIPPQAPYNPGQQNQMLGPQQTIQQGVERLRAFIDTNMTSNPAGINSFLQQQIAPYFDFDAMTRLVLGPLDYQLTTKQRYAVRIMIRNHFLQALASNLANYRGGQIDYMNVSGNLGYGRVRVRLRIYRPGLYPMGIELRIARTNAGWKIYDVAANGISAVAHYRNYIQSVILRSGPAGLTRMP